MGPLQKRELGNLSSPALTLAKVTSPPEPEVVTPAVQPTSPKCRCQLLLTSDQRLWYQTWASKPSRLLGKQHTPNGSRMGLWSCLPAARTSGSHPCSLARFVPRRLRSERAVAGGRQ